VLNLTFTGCGSQPDTSGISTDEKRLTIEKVTPGGVYRAPLLNNPATLDPAYVQDEYGTAVIQQLFDGLVRFDPYLMVLPGLAETWQIEENGKQYRFIIHGKARFQNGENVTAQDVVFSLSRLLRVDPSPAILPHLLKIVGAKAYRDFKTDSVDGLQARDDKIVLITLESSHAPFLTALGMNQAKIVPKAEVIKQGSGFGRNPVGSGPFQFVSWETNRQIKLKRFADYYTGASFLDGIEYRIFPGIGMDQILSEFRKGNLDEMPVWGDIKQELATTEGLKWFHRPSLSLMFYGIRVNHPFLENPEIRRALSMAIDRKKLIDQVYEGQFEPARSILPPGMPGFSRENELLADDITAAKETINATALEEEGNTVPVVEIVSNSKSAFAQAELSFLKDTWALLGIDLKIKYIPDWSDFETYLKSDQVQIYRYAWSADMPDPDSILHPLFASDSPFNFMRFDNQKIDQMLLSARENNDPVNRTAIYRQIETQVMESSPIIPLLYLNVDRVYRSNVEGAQPSALGAHTMPLYGVWLKKDVSSN
jgi:ABC-type transport system substrate-binding protein